MSIEILTIAHQQQRYNTVGDYQTDVQGNTVIRVSDLGNRDMEFLIAYHELTELTLCRKMGITDAMIDEFDVAFAESRPVGDGSEPGDDPDCPYYHQHQFAEKMERMMAEQLGVDWDTYIKKCTEAMATYPK